MNKPFLDIRTGKWFATLPELKEFQRTGVMEDNKAVQNRPRTAPKEIAPQPVEPKPLKASAPVNTEEAVQEEQEEDFEVDYTEKKASVTVHLTREEMEEALSEAGVDRRSWARKSDTALAKLYLEIIKR